MKNFLLSLTILVSVNLSCFAQKEQVTIKAGTIVPLEAIKEVRGAKAHEGEPVDFKLQEILSLMVELPYPPVH